MQQFLKEVVVRKDSFTKKIIKTKSRGHVQSNEKIVIDLKSIE